MPRPMPPGCDLHRQRSRPGGRRKVRILRILRPGVSPILHKGGVSVRVLCLDIGEKRIGVAVTDPLNITAQAVETIAEQDDHDPALLSLLLNSLYALAKSLTAYIL